MQGPENGFAQTWLHFQVGSTKLMLVSSIYTRDLDVTTGEQVIFKHMQE